jgi:hypothetical protein
MYFTLDRTVFERSFFALLKNILLAKKDTLLAGGLPPGKEAGEKYEV